MKQNGGTLAGTALSLGTGIVSQAMANKQNVELMHEQMAFNQRESEKQRRATYEQWLRELAYNNPQSQVDRLKAAGINPALVFGGSMDNSAPASGAMAEASGSGLARVSPYQLDPLTAAQVENLKAKTDQTRQETEGKKIENSIGRLNEQAFKSAYEEGLVHSAMKAGFAKDIANSRLSAYSLFSSAWNYAILTGISMEESLNETELYHFGDTYSFETGLPVIPYSEKSFERAKSLFIADQESQKAALDAAKKMSELEQEKNDKNFDIWKVINDDAEAGKTWAQVLRIGLWLWETIAGGPSIRLPGRTKINNHTTIGTINNGNK